MEVLDASDVRLLKMQEFEEKVPLVVQRHKAVEAALHTGMLDTDMSLLKAGVGRQTDKSYPR